MQAKIRGRTRKTSRQYVPEERQWLALSYASTQINSMRSIERITGIGKTTILNLLVLAGEKCERVMRERIKGVAVKDVEADEIWAFVQFKNRYNCIKK